jgi:LppP/LprE lipoprotein
MEILMRMPSLRLTAVVALMATLLPLVVSAQEASWLDGDLVSWNTPGMAIPAAAEIDGNLDPRCTERERPAETAEDEALVAEGWRLFLPYQRGWGVTLVWGLSSYDGMCRPLGFQAFVFVDGAFAGTVSPDLMNSRFDGAADTVNLWYKDQLGAQFRRYAPDDPLCCPSGSVSVDYTIEQTPDGPVLNPVSKT